MKYKKWGAGAAPLRGGKSPTPPVPNQSEKSDNRIRLSEKNRKLLYSDIHNEQKCAIKNNVQLKCAQQISIKLKTLKLKTLKLKRMRCGIPMIDRQLAKVSPPLDRIVIGCNAQRQADRICCAKLHR